MGPNRKGAPNGWRTVVDAMGGGLQIKHIHES